jgi:hypothetical protein
MHGPTNVRVDLGLHSLYIPLMRLQVRYPFKLSTHTATSLHTLEPPLVDAKCLHISTAHAYLRDPYDFCNKPPPCPETAFHDSPSQLTTRVSCAVRTEPSHIMQEHFRRRGVSFADILDFQPAIFRCYPLSCPNPSVSLHHKFHKHDSVYTHRCFKYAVFNKLSLRNGGLVSPKLNTERNLPHHERANGNGKVLI